MAAAAGAGGWGGGGGGDKSWDKSWKGGGGWYDEKTGMAGMIPRMAKTRSTLAGSMTAGGARSVVRRLT